MAGIYVHVPFCKSKCTYCDFASFPKEIGKAESYFACLYREIEGRAKQYPATILDKIATIAAPITPKEGINNKFKQTQNTQPKLCVFY